MAIETDIQHYIVDSQGNKHFVEIEKQGETFFTNAVEPSSFLEARKLDEPLSIRKEKVSMYRCVSLPLCKKELHTQEFQEPTVEIAHNALSPVVNLSVSRETIRDFENDRWITFQGYMDNHFIEDFNKWLTTHYPESGALPEPYHERKHHSPAGCLEGKEDEWETLEDDWYKE